MKYGIYNCITAQGLVELCAIPLSLPCEVLDETNHPPSVQTDHL